MKLQAKGPWKKHSPVYVVACWLMDFGHGVTGQRSTVWCLFCGGELTVLVANPVLDGLQSGVYFVEECYRIRRPTISGELYSGRLCDGYNS